MIHYVPCSGGKDSTALLLRLLELGEPNIEPVITPTGDELPEMEEHWAKIEALIGTKITRIACPSLFDLIDTFQALPNWRMRWCTRMIKIVPFQAFVSAHKPCIISVGLRADEPDELRSGMEMEGDTTGIIQRYPLREWGWGFKEVMQYLNGRGIKIPKRTDCGMCFFQRLPEWYALWQNYPLHYAKYEAMEERIGHTLRSDGRDTWPAPLKGLRQEFERGRVPKERQRKETCRVCSL